MKRTIIIILVSLLFGFLLSTATWLGCHRCPTPQADTTYVRDTIKGDPYPVIIPIPKPYPVDAETLKIPADIDTAAIIAKYHIKLQYDRVLKDDTSALVRIVDFVYANELYGGYLEFQNRRPIAINTTIINPAPQCPSISLYAKAGLVVDSVARVKVGLGATKGRNGLWYEYEPFFNRHHVGYSIRLFSK